MNEFTTYTYRPASELRKGDLLFNPTGKDQEIRKVSTESRITMVWVDSPIAAQYRTHAWNATALVRVALDTESSASRGHHIETGEYMTHGETLEWNPPFEVVACTVWNENKEI